jgi:hypothetical protein
MRRCVVPMTSFSVKDAHGTRHAVSRIDGDVFGAAGIWENWRDPETGHHERTFAIVTVPANALLAPVHDRMPAILEKADIPRWMGAEKDPRDLFEDISVRTAYHVSTPRHARAAGQMKELTPILTDATAAIEPEYFLLNIAGGDPVYRERIYSYELYHQMRLRWPEGCPFWLNGEVDKSGHALLAALGADGRKPDLLVHRPGSMAGNYAILEVKSAGALNGGVDKDIDTLSLFRNDVGYRRANLFDLRPRRRYAHPSPAEISHKRQKACSDRGMDSPGSRRTSFSPNHARRIDLSFGGHAFQISYGGLSCRV